MCCRADRRLADLRTMEPGSLGSLSSSSSHRMSAILVRCWEIPADSTDRVGSAGGEGGREGGKEGESEETILQPTYRVGSEQNVNIQCMLELKQILQDWFNCVTI